LYLEAVGTPNFLAIHEIPKEGKGSAAKVVHRTENRVFLPPGPLFSGEIALNTQFFPPCLEPGKMAVSCAMPPK